MVDSETIDLAIAHPPLELLPSNADVLEWASGFVRGRPATDIVGYGEHAGLGEARIAIAEWLGQAHVGPEKWEPSGLELVLSAGVSGGIDMCARSLNTWYEDGIEMGCVALVEEKTYELAPPILEAAGLNIVRVPSDKDGVVPEGVAAEVRARGGAGGGKNSVRLLYIVPSHGNPTGATLSAERRSRLLALSQELRFYIVSDEIYGLLSFRSGPPAPLSASGVPNVLSINSVSKLCSPGLRVGWIHCTDSSVRSLIADIPLATSGGSPVSALAAAAVAWAAESGELGKRTSKARILLFERAAALSEALELRLQGTKASLWPCSGGYFLWLSLPTASAALAIAKALEDGLPRTLVGILPSQSGLRLCFAGVPCKLLTIAAQRIGDVVREVLSLNNTSRSDAAFDA